MNQPTLRHEDVPARFTGHARPLAADLFYFRMMLRVEALAGARITDPRKLFTATLT